MSEQPFVLTTTPTLIADGTKAAYIQEIIGSEVLDAICKR